MNYESYRPGLAKDEALVSLLRDFQKNPQSLSFIPLSEAYRKNGLLAQALEVLEEGLEVHKNLPSALVAKARVLFEMKRFAESLAILNFLLKETPENIKAIKLQAEIYIRLGQRRSAIRVLNRLVTLYPSDLEAIKTLETLENQEDGLNIPVQNMSKAYVESPSATLQLGKIGDFEVKSMQESWQGVAIREEHQSVSMAISQATDDENSELNQEDDEPAIATKTIAELYLRQGLKRKAQKVLQKMLRVNPTNAWARETLQELKTDGIVPLESSSNKNGRKQALQNKVKRLELLISRFRMMKSLSSY
ncbi:MAG: tetratricopeptide repeat protein [Oligoflexia bacterium]|nr:tetratricopeptide repeat protein [Oligoflexia bacterium]